MKVSLDYFFHKISGVLIHDQVCAVGNQPSHEADHHALLKTLLLPALRSDHGPDVLAMSALNVCLEGVERVGPQVVNQTSKYG